VCPCEYQPSGPSKSALIAQKYFTNMHTCNETVLLSVRSCKFKASVSWIYIIFQEIRLQRPSCNLASEAIKAPFRNCADAQLYSKIIICRMMSGDIIAGAERRAMKVAY
jgi:hypothetical protein